jgi:hypothetical protein
MRILKEFESKPKRRIGLDSFWSSLWHHPIKTVSYYWTVFLWLYHDDDRYLRMSGKKRRNKEWDKSEKSQEKE